jgi:hypothetical protein
MVNRSQRLGLFHVVRRVHPGFAALLEGLEIFEDGVAALRVHAHGRLVEKQDLRIVQQRRRQVETSLHAAAELSHFVLSPVREPYQVERLGHGVFYFCAIQIVQSAEKREVIAG